MKAIVRFCTVIFSLLFIGNLAARPSAYHRAQQLADDDPIEAEALFVHYIAQGGNAKLKRAAAHELFSLRLKYGWLPEAFMQARSSAFRSRFLSAAEEGLRLSAQKTRQLVTHLRHECRKDGDAQSVGDMLAKGKYPLAAYNFAVRVLELCKVEQPGLIFPQFSPENGADTRSLLISLLQAREAIVRDDFEQAAGLIDGVRAAYDADEKKEAGVMLQIDFTEARLAAKKEDFPALQRQCTALEKKKPPKYMRNACRFLTAYALMMQEKYAAAYARVAPVKISALEPDNRLLRLTAAVAAGELKAEKLIRFTRRRSYNKCAPVLRKLARSVLGKI